MKMKDAIITRRMCPVLLAILAFSTIALPAAAQTSVYGSMAAVGTFNANLNGDWVTTPNMMLVGNNQWQGEFYISTPSNSFKFVANNNWNYQWQDTNQNPSFQLPLSSTAQFTNARGGDIIMKNTEPGFYRFTFNDQTWDYRVDLLYTIASGVNIISNPSFEVQGTDPEKAQCWQWTTNDSHGSYWNDGGNGTPRRRNWRGHSGSWEATVEGKYWSSREDFGGWWREGAATPGLTYQGSAWFWADLQPGLTWTAQVMEIKIEFYDAGFRQLLYVASQFQGINENWSKKTVTAVAPTGTVWGRLVVASSGNGTQGAFQFDDVELRPVASRDQDFNLWISYTNDNTYTLDDWTVSTGKATTINARSGYCISLPGPGSVSNFIRSPQFVDGVGTITFWYRNGYPDPDVGPTEPVSFLVQTSPDGTIWTTIGSVTNIFSQQYKAYSVFVYQATPYYMRIVHGSGTNRLLIDDVTVAVPVGSTRYMDFNTWDDLGTNMGTHNYLNWIVTTGRVSTINARDGKSLLLPANAAATNNIHTPLFPDGYGEISFYYARGTNGIGLSAFAIQSSPDATNWSTIATASNIMSTGYAQYQGYFYETNASYVRICNVTSPPNPDATLLIDEGFIGGETPPPGWTFSGINNTYGSEANSGREIPSIQFDTSNDYVCTPALSSPTNLSFWLKGVTTSTSNNQFLVEQASGGAWAAITNISPLPTSGTNYSFPVATSVTNIRFTYKKVYRNAAFDDVIIHSVPGAPQPPQDLLIDDINVDHPVLLRTQNFNSWPTEDSYGTYMFYGWTVNDGQITAEGAYDGQVAHMNFSPSSGQYIQSSRMPDGIGTISFVYARWSTSGTANVYYDIQLSPDGVTWTSNDTINVTNTSYTAYQKYFYDTTNHYLRLYHRSGGVIASFDNISISALGPRADVILNTSYTPATPYTNDPVYLQCSVIPRYGASVLSVTSYYRVGTSDAFTALSMIVTDRVNYVSTSAIPAQAAGATVQYYVRCDFTGPGSEANTPTYSPSGGSNSPAAYYIPRNPHGRVWINELNYLNDRWPGDDTNEFVELCGPAGIDVSGWKIELYISVTNISYTYYGSYTIPNGTVLPNNTNGYGFFVVGDSDVSPKNMTLTSVNDIDGTHISDGLYPSGVSLINEGNGVEQSLSYEGSLSGFSFIPAIEVIDDYPDPYSLQLGGTGSNYSGFVWQTNLYTPGAVNVGQMFEGEEPGTLPLVNILGYSRGVTMLSLMLPATNGWTPEVRYATKLMPQPPTWILISPRTVTTNAGVWTIQFNYPSGEKNCVFRVEAWK